MHISMVPFVIALALGAAVGWIVRDRDCYKSRLEDSADADTKKTAGDAASTADT